MKELYNQLFSDGRYTKSFEEFQKQFNSQDNAKLLFQNLSNDGLYTKEYADFQNQFGLGKAIPSAPGAAVEEIVAPENNTELNLGSGSLELQSEPSFFKQLGDAWKGGSVGAEYDEFMQKALYSSEYSKNVPEEDLTKIFELFKKEDLYSQTPGEAAWNNAYDKYEKEGSKYMPDFIYAALRATVEEGVDNLFLIGARSTARQFSKEVLPYAAGGGTLGYTYGKGGTRMKAAQAAYGFFTGVGAGAELFGSMAESIKRELPENYTQEDIDNFFKDEEAMRKARNRAVTRSGTITLFNLIGGVGAKKLAGFTNKKVLELGGSQRAGAIVSGAGVTAVGSTSEFTGEIAAQSFSGDEIDLKEGVLEVIGLSPVSVMQAGNIANVVKKPEYKIGNQKVSRQDINNFIDDNEGIDLAKISLSIKNDNTLQEKANRKTRIATNKVQVDKRITDDSKRTAIAELEFEKQKLEGNKSRTAQNRKKEINSEIDAIQQEFIKPGRRDAQTNEQISEIAQQQDELTASIIDRVRSSLLQKTTDFATTAAKQLNLEDPSIVNNKEELLAKLKEDNVTITPDYLAKINSGRVGGAVFNGRIYIDKQAAAKYGQINVGAHEILHPILNAKIGNSKEQGKIVSQFKQRLSSEQRDTMEKLMKKYTPDQYNTEYLTVFSDAITKKQIKFEDSLFTKIGDFIVSLLRPLGFTNISFKDGKGVYNFMKEYNKSIKKGKLSKAALQAIGGPITAEQATLQFSTADQSFVQELGANQTLQQWKQKGSEVAIEKMYTAGTFEKLIGSKITPQMRQLPDFNQEDFIMDAIGELIPHIRNFNPEVNDNLSGWVNSQLQNKINSVLKKGEATQQQFTADISEVEERVEFDNTEIGDMSELIAAENQRLESLINPLDILPNDLKNAYIDAVKEALKDLDINNLTFKNLNDLAPEITGQFFGIPTIKVQQATKNLNQKEIPGVQQILKDNAKILLALLPDGSIKEAASEKLINTGTMVPRKLQQAFYTQQERLTKGAGLIPFELKKNLTVQDFYKPFGIRPDGTFIPVGGQTPQAQSMLAMIRLAGKLMTNTTVRSLIELQNDKAGVINLNIGAGTSDLQLSYETAETYQGSLDGVISNNEQTLKSIHGLNNGQIQKLQQTSILIADKSSGNQTFIYEDLKDFLDMQDQFRLFMPSDLFKYGLYGLLNSYSGDHYRVNSYGVTFKPTHIKKLQLRDGTVLNENSPEALELKERFEAGYRNSIYSTSPDIAKYSQTTRDLLNDLLEAIKSESPKLLSSSNLTTIKDNLSISKDNQAIFDIQSNKNANLIRQKLFNLLKSLEVDFVNQEKKGSLGRLNRLIFSKQLAGANSQIINGEKSLGTLEGGIIYDEVVTNWRHEHMDPSVKVASKGFSNVVLGQHSPIVSRTLLISLEDAKAMDKSPSNGGVGKTASYDQKINWLKNNSKGKIYKNGKIQFNLANEFYDKIKANEAAYNKIKAEDQFDMLETVTRQMFPQSANQPRGSYQSLTPEQRRQVFDRMQDNGMIAPGVQFSLGSDIAQKISNKSEIDANVEISEKKARLLGKNKGKWSFFIPPSADDFAGLMYYMVGSGKQGDADLAWFKQNLFDPFAKGINDFTTYRQTVMGQFRQMKKLLRGQNIKLKAANETGFSNETAIRVYIWTKRGMEIPGLSETEVKELTKIVSSNTALKNFAGQVLNLTNFAETPEVEKSWDGGTLTTDILDYLNTSSREKFLAEYLSNAEEIFGKFGQSGEIEGETANRLRAAFGDGYIEALSDVLYRMKTGRRRITGGNRLTNKFINWVNDSVGAIMFFNTRSALLQQLSFVNFINFSDNNPLAAADAFMNSDQFWDDYTMLFNSDFLKERRSGLKTDVNADEIAKAAEDGRNPIRSVIASILKKGFLPTQIADSHAIAIGGASFYRNRLNRYMKEGMKMEDAQQQAFLDFQEIAEESQQSSRPDRISMQQASGLGRIILAFANTPMQYARLTKKAALDLAYGRGDWKTNLSKLMYYGAVQNIIFSSLQSALFAMAFDDDEEEEKVRNRYFRVANSSADGLLRGLGFGGAVVSTLKNMVLEGIRQSKLGRPNYEKVAYEALKLSPPISSKITKLASAGRAFTYRNTREKMTEAGFTLDNPAYMAVGQIVSATTNIPADRVIRKLDNLTTPVRQDVENWQAISLALGYSKWDVGLIEEDTKNEKKKPKVIKRKSIKRKSLK